MNRIATILTTLLLTFSGTALAQEQCYYGPTKNNISISFDRNYNFSFTYALSERWNLEATTDLSYKESSNDEATREEGKDSIFHNVTTNSRGTDFGLGVSYRLMPGKQVQPTIGICGIYRYYNSYQISNKTSSTNNTNQFSDQIQDQLELRAFLRAECFLAPKISISGIYYISARQINELWDIKRTDKTNRDNKTLQIDTGISYDLAFNFYF